MQLTNRLEQAVRTASWAHRNQIRKGTNVPYIIHPFSVMLVAQAATTDEDTLIACLFHDILEDAPQEYPEITMRAEFGENVVKIVKAVTKDDSIGDWRTRSEAYLQTLADSQNKAAMTVACADKIHNLMSVLNDYQSQGDAIWDIFSADKYAQVWWYESVYETIATQFPDLVLLTQLEELIAQLKEIVTTDD